MARMIDADELIERVPKPSDKDSRISRNRAIADMVILICDSPTVDAVSVVRCEGCKYFSECYKKEYIGFCSCLNSTTKPDGFCSYGERKENE